MPAMSIVRPSLPSLVVVLSLATPRSWAAEPSPDTNALWFAEHYTKFEHRIPMRDGVRLFTAVYAPKDTSERYPFLLTRTPYSVAPYGVDNYRASLGPSESFEREGFIFVYQDARGRYMSEGEFQQVRPYVADKRGPKDVDESTDTYDTIEWLLKNVPDNNGRVGMVGISQPGFHVAASIIDSHPALKAISPAVNDPTTALTCIDQLGRILVRAVRREHSTPNGVRARKRRGDGQRGGARFRGQRLDEVSPAGVRMRRNPHGRSQCG